MSDMEPVAAASDASAQAELRRAFEHTQRALLDVQRELGGVMARAAADPWMEYQDRRRLEDLNVRRKDLLMSWARLALSWTLRGGEVRLEGVAADAPTPPPPPPPPLLLDRGERGERGEPEIITRTRIRRVEPLRRGFEPGEAEDAAPPPRVELDMDHERLIELLRMLGEPTTPLDSVERVREELSRLSAGSATSRLDEWASYPKQVQKALVGMCVARSRHLQDEVPEDLLPMELTGDLDRLFSTMTGYSKREQPGFVFGLQRHHHPMGLTWLADARRWWADLVDFLPEPSVLSPDRALGELRRRIQAGLEEEKILAQATIALEAGISAEDPRLVTMMEPLYDALRAEAKFKHLRKAIRDTRKLDEKSNAELANPEVELPEDWACEGMVEGRHAAVVGGPLPEAARKRLAEVFRWSQVDWVEGDHPRALENLAERARQGEVDQVVVLRRFVGDDADRVLLPVCDAGGIPVADVHSGFGITAVRQAREQAFARH